MQYKAVLRSVKLLCNQRTAPVFRLRGLDHHTFFTCLFPWRLAEKVGGWGCRWAVSDGDTDMNQSTRCLGGGDVPGSRLESSSRSVMAKTRDLSLYALGVSKDEMHVCFVWTSTYQERWDVLALSRDHGSSDGSFATAAAVSVSSSCRLRTCMCRSSTPNVMEPSDEHTKHRT
jgi:hypothetical protein